MNSHKKFYNDDKEIENTKNAACSGSDLYFAFKPELGAVAASQTVKSKFEDFTEKLF